MTQGRGLSEPHFNSHPQLTPLVWTLRLRLSPFTLRAELAQTIWNVDGIYYRSICRYVSYMNVRLNDGRALCGYIMQKVRTRLTIVNEKFDDTFFLLLSKISTTWKIFFNSSYIHATRIMYYCSKKYLNIFKQNSRLIPYGDVLIENGQTFRTWHDMGRRLRLTEYAFDWITLGSWCEI